MIRIGKKYGDCYSIWGRTWDLCVWVDKESPMLDVWYYNELDFSCVGFKLWKFRLAFEWNLSEQR